MYAEIDNLDRIANDLRKDNNLLKQQLKKALKDLYDAQQQVIEMSGRPVVEEQMSSVASNRHESDSFS